MDGRVARIDKKESARADHDDRQDRGGSESRDHPHPRDASRLARPGDCLIPVKGGGPASVHRSVGVIDGKLGRGGLTMKASRRWLSLSLVAGVVLGLASPSYAQSYDVNFQVYSGQYIVAENGGGD